MEAIKVYYIDFYRMLCDLIPLRSVMITASSKDDAHRKAEKLALAWGYNPGKMVIQSTDTPVSCYDSRPRDREGDIEFVSGG